VANFSFSHSRVLVVGDVMLDKYWYGNVERISPESPVPIVDVQREVVTLGGAANVAANVVGLGAKCTLLSIIGRDDAGDQIVKLCEQAGIKSDLSFDDKVRTTEKLRIVARNQQLIRADFESDPTHEVLADKLNNYFGLLDHVDVVILSDYGKGGLKHIQDMIVAAKSKSIPIVVDPKGGDYSRYRGATVVTPNLKEFQQAGGEVRDTQSMQSSAVDIMIEHDFDELLLTRSEKGMTWFSRDGDMVHSPAVAREVFDVSGAGDTVAAVFGVGIAIGLARSELLGIANHAAGCVVSKFGTAAIDINELSSFSRSGDGL
jgi:rfaE bifunctional protein kinase chain/domain